MGSFSASLKTIGDTRGIPATVELLEGRLSIKAGDSEIGDWPLEDVALEPTTTGYRLAAEGDQVLLEMSDSERFGEELEKSSRNGRKKKRRLFSRKEKKGESKVEKPPAGAPAVETPQEPKREVARIPASVPANERIRPTEPDRPAVPEPVTTAEKKGDGPSFSTRLVEFLDQTIDATERRWGPLLPDWVFNRIVFVAAFLLIVLAFVFRGTASVVLLVAGVIALMVGGAAYTDDVMASKLLPGRATPTHLLLAGVGLLAVGIGFGLIA
jgi:hypothetical protein